MSATAAARPRLDLPVTAGAAGAIVVLAGVLAEQHLWRSIGVLLTAVALGWVFVTESFGFTGAFRLWMTRRDGRDLAAGLVVAAICALVVVPVTTLVPGYGGYAGPLGVSLLGGAALFGLGMQLANGCGSGTLYAFGSGSRRMWVTLPFFCLGGFLGSLALPTALSLPALPQVVLPEVLGAWGGLAVTLAATVALIALVTFRGRLPEAPRLRAAVTIGVLASLLFLFSGQPWGVTTGLTLWGAKAAAALGFDVASATYWSWDGPRAALTGSVLGQDSSLADIGMILGATTASAWAGGFRTQPWPEARGLIAAAIGGLLMGFGARLSFGCNIGALVGGIASGSLHGFVWFFAVLPGCWLGIRLRPVFGLSR